MLSKKGSAQTMHNLDNRQDGYNRRRTPSFAVVSCCTNKVATAPERPRATSFKKGGKYGVPDLSSRLVARNLPGRQPLIIRARLTIASRGGRCGCETPAVSRRAAFSWSAHAISNEVATTAEVWFGIRPGAQDGGAG